MWSTEPQFSVSANNLMSNSLFLKKLWLSNPIFKLCSLITRQKRVSHCLNTFPLNLMNQDGAINFNCCVKMWFRSRIWWVLLYLTTCGENGLFFFLKKKRLKPNKIFHTGVTRRNNKKRNPNVRVKSVGGKVLSPQATTPASMFHRSD